MKKLLSIFILLTSLITIIGCATESKETIIEGRNLGVNHNPNMITVFVKDNHGGKDLINLDPNEFINNDEYSVEAYRVKLTNETTFINEETGEEFHIDFLDLEPLFSSKINNNDYLMYLYEWSGRKVAVTVDEGYTKTISTDRNNYITYSSELLPIVTAKEIRFFPLSYENFIFSHTQASYDTLLMVDTIDTSSTEFSNLWNNLWADISRLSDDRFINIVPMTYEQFQKYNIPNTIETFPYFYVFGEKSIVKETNNWDEVLDYLDSEVSKNEEVND